jgi:hypothetical protein
MAGRRKGSSKLSLGSSAGERNVNRERIQQVVTENLEDHLQVLLDTVKHAQKEDWVLCPHCNRKHPVSRPDYRAAESAIRTLHELGFGKPKAEGEDGGAGFVLKRVIVEPGGA